MLKLLLLCFVNHNVIKTECLPRFLPQRVLSKMTGHSFVKTPLHPFFANLKTKPVLQTVNGMKPKISKGEVIKKYITFS